MPDRPPTRTMLREVGECLYGERWRASLARDLGVDHRTVERWDAGHNPMPDTLRGTLRQLLDDRETQIHRVKERLNG